MSETFIGGAVCREFESEVPVAEEMLDRVVCSREQFSFQMCTERRDGSGTFRNWRQSSRQLVPCQDFIACLCACCAHLFTVYCVFRVAILLFSKKTRYAKIYLGLQALKIISLKMTGQLLSDL